MPLLLKASRFTKFGKITSHLSPTEQLLLWTTVGSPLKYEGTYLRDILSTTSYIYFNQLKPFSKTSYRERVWLFDSLVCF